ncbi:hypothetical protein CNR22_07030 [Sphingobacteriaceae bacterium]|nr:hypothetical protein CNR22_07030 [Sphingobacteriaceae bacterium]
MEDILISILMPAYNCEKFVKQAIESILNQSYKNFELLVADDCSTDKTKEIIDTFSDPRIKPYHNEINLGYLKASNKLFKVCKGELITFQDADDYADSERLARLKKFLDENKEVACVGSNIVKVDADGKEFFKSTYALKDEQIRNDFLHYKIVMTGSALMLRKQVIEKLGIYNEYFDRIGSEDTYLFSLILDHFKVSNIPDALYYYRANPNSVGALHRNPKAFVGHEMIVQFYGNRKQGKPDFIAAGDWKSADDYAYYLMAINKTNESPFAAIGSFVSAGLKAPRLFPVFLRQFAAHFKAAALHKK